MGLTESLINLLIGLVTIFGVLALVVALVVGLILAVTWAIEPLDDDDEEEEFRANCVRQLEEQLELDRQRRSRTVPLEEHDRPWHQPR